MCPLFSGRHKLYGEEGIDTLFTFGNQSKRLLNIVADQKPAATADLRGDARHPKIRGVVAFYPAEKGTIVVVEIKGLPSGTGQCGYPVLGFHIHENGRCTGNASDPFADTGPHYNPHNCKHPFHAGDMPPLFSNNGFAWMAFYTERFTVKEIIGRAVIVHDSADDFTSQPAGNSGKKIACGDIVRRF
jgi:Cu-Zn family superoxide dismutase